MKKTINIAIIVLIVVAVGYAVYALKNDNLGGGWFASGETLVGSAANLVSLPKEAYFADATTTPATGEYEMIDGNAAVDQKVITEKYDTVFLNIQAKGDTATSTMYVRQMGSYDGTYYFDLATSSEDYIGKVASSTLAVLPVRSWSWDPGIATTSVSIPFDTHGHKYTRFILWAENASTDPTDGVQAWITAVRVEPITR